MKIFKRILFLLFCLSSIILEAQSQSFSDSLLTEINLDDIVVTAQYAPTAAENAVHQVKIIKAADIQKEGQNNLAEVLANQLNFRVSNDPILGNGLKIQGIGGENIQIMIDGVPVIGRLNGNVDLSQINVNNIQRIEIIEGAMSAQYGSNASGGIVNIITKKSQVKRFEANLQGQYENIGITNASARFGMQFGKLYIALSGARNNSSFANRDSLRLYKEVELADGETFKTKVTPWNPKLQHNADATIRYRFSDSTKLTYQYRHFNERLSSYGEVRRPQFRPYAFDEFYSTYRKDHSLNFESYLGKFLYLNTTTAYNQFDRYKETQRWDMESDTSELVDGGQDTTGFSSMLHRSILSSVFTKALNGQIGIEFLSETGTGERIIDTTSLPINETMIRNYAIWGSLKYDFNQMVIKANLRYGYNTKYNHPLIPSVHFNWKINKELKLQMSYAQGFRAPSLKELYFNFVDINHFIIGNENLKAERSQNTSLGINYEKAISKNRYSLSGKLFYNKIKDRIIIAEFEPFKFNYQNLEKFETHGFNIEAKYEFNKIFSLQSAIAYTRLFNLWSNDFDADKFTGLYEMQNRISFSIPKINAGIVLSHRFIGRQTRFYQDDENVLRQGFIGDYHQINATLNYGFWKERIFIAGGVKNLTNVKSVSFLGEGEGHSNIGNSQLVNWGRTFFVRMSLTI